MENKSNEIDNVVDNTINHEMKSEGVTNSNLGELDELESEFKLIKLTQDDPLLYMKVLCLLDKEDAEKLIKELDTIVEKSTYLLDNVDNYNPLPSFLTTDIFLNSPCLDSIKFYNVAQNIHRCNIETHVCVLIRKKMVDWFNTYNDPRRIIAAIIDVKKGSIKINGLDELMDVFLSLCNADEKKMSLHSLSTYHDMECDCSSSEENKSRYGIKFTFDIQYAHYNRLIHIKINAAELPDTYRFRKLLRTSHGNQYYSKSRKLI